MKSFVVPSSPVATGLPVGACVSVVALCLSAHAAFAEPARQRIDRDDLALMRASSPAAADDLVQGEERELEGDMTGAADLFGRAAALFPASALAARRSCQALAELGRRSEALTACRRAVANQGSAMDLRALVHALMSGDSKPAMHDVSEALTMARSAQRKMPTEAYGYAAACDIAVRLGDKTMLESCISDLERVAPGHEETRRAEAEAAALFPSWPIWVTWLTVAAAALVTLGHALATRLRAMGPPRRGRAGAAAVAAMLVLAFATPRLALADVDPASLGGDPSDLVRQESSGFVALSKWPVDDTDPVKSIPDPKAAAKDPLQMGYWLMDLNAKAEQAVKRGDHAAAVRFYQAMGKAVPDRAVSFGKMCDEYDALGDWTNAVASCRAALGLGDPTVHDYRHFVELTLSRPGKLSAAETADVVAAVDHLKESDSADVKRVGSELDCEVGLRMENTPRLRQCTTALAASAPDDPKTISYEWALALRQHDFAGAHRTIDHARATSMKPEAIASMETATSAAEATAQRWFAAWIVAGAIAVLAMAAAAVLAFIRRRPRALRVAAAEPLN